MGYEAEVFAAQMHFLVAQPALCKRWNVLCFTNYPMMFTEFVLCLLENYRKNEGTCTRSDFG